MQQAIINSLAITVFNLDSRSQKQVAAAVPLLPYLSHRRPTKETAVAVSVFDAWLGPERYSELDCDSIEQSRRNARQNALCASLRKHYDVFAIRRRGRYAQRPVFRRFGSDAEYQAYVDANDMDRSSRQFFALAVPALGLVYEQHWDDTNIGWFKSSDGLTRLRALAADSGLYLLNFDL